MRQHESALEAFGIQVIVVTFEVGAAARNYVRESNLPWPMLVDETRSLYQAYNMDRGRWWDIYGPSAWWIYAKLLLKGRRLQKAVGNFDQLGGAVLIDPEGFVRLHHVGKGPADRPSVDSLLEVVRSATP